MQPTIEAELAALRRTLDALGTGGSLPAGATEELAAAARTLKRLERTCSRVLPYLAFDNAATADLLRELAPMVPGALRSEIEAAVSAPGPAPDPSVFEVAAVNERNELLRGLLSRVILAWPAEPASATEMRVRVAACLRQSLEMRPW